MPDPEQWDLMRFSGRFPIQDGQRGQIPHQKMHSGIGKIIRRFFCFPNAVG
jgi:hypothetical protein